MHQRIDESFFFRIVSLLSLSWLLQEAYPQLSNVGGFYTIPGLNHTAYYKKGDINIGVLFGIYSSSSKTALRCDKLKVTSLVLQRMEAVVYAVEMINNDTALMPNVTLGFVILDECDTDNSALAQSLSFLPMTSDSCFVNICNSSSSSVANSSLPTNSNAISHYDVVGIIGPNRSDRSIAIALLYSIARIPIISYKATTDTLSDKINYRYFLRVIPPDKHQVRAMMTFIRNHNWTYISVLYSAGTYGEPAFDNIQTMAPKMGICIASSRRLSLDSNFKTAAKGLLEVSRARVVILFLTVDLVAKVFKEIRDLKATGSFIWIGSDGWAGSMPSLTSYFKEVAGTITFSPLSTPVPSFDNYFRSRVRADCPNPWMVPTWEMLYGCSLVKGTCDISQGFPNTTYDFTFAEGNSNVLDAVFTFGHAIDQLLRDTCPEARGKDVQHCVKGELLLEYLLNTSFDGVTGTVRFDEFGDGQSKYRINQVYPKMLDDGNFTGVFSEVTVAFYSITTDNIQYSNNHSLSWEFYQALEQSGQNLMANQAPESICSYPCKDSEFKIPTKLECCWDCRACRENERIIYDLEVPRCEVCSGFHWPDPKTNFTTCQPIPVTYPSFSSTLPLILVILSVAAMILTTVIITAYIFLREARVIKAASRELSFLQLVAILVGYITVICFQSTPTHAMCSTLYYLFCLSFTWLYSPLLVKAIRIYRIFQSGTKGKHRPRFISPISQLVMAATLIAMQVILIQ